jgi:2-polyprenyl-3-methyl-5-hydroxy-6-metoxy-1,4-benzoquinol methylase
MKDLLNARVKHREPFRPFAPSVLEEKASGWFDVTTPAQYMIMNAQVKQPDRIPAVTHADGSARLQTVSQQQNGRFYGLVKCVEEVSGIPVVINTSFNDNEAIVESPADALKTFLNTSIDYLIMGDYFIEKNLQYEWNGIAVAAPTVQKAKNAVLNQAVFDLVKKHGKGKTLFDYGCGWGEFSGLMQEQGYTVSAFDYADEMVSLAKKNFAQPTFLYKKDYDNMSPQLEGKFDIVISNLVLCILNKEQQINMIAEMKSLLKKGGTIVVSFCHPQYDYLPDSVVSKRIVPPKATYPQEFLYEKVIKENGFRFHDYHRPMEYYNSLFKENGLKVLDMKDSDTLGTAYKPDFVIIALSRD